MAKQFFSNYSFGLLSTNPKLSTNIKLMVDSNDDLYLESFSANEALSNNKFKGYKIDPNSKYSVDLFNFYNKGQFPKKLAYDVFQANDSNTVMSKYTEQFEMFYKAGARRVISEKYTEDMAIFAPIWLEKDVPDYFVIFKIEGPVNINSRNATTENLNEAAAKDPDNFIDNVIKKSTIIKTFDLRKTTNLGKYIRNHVNDEAFPISSVTLNVNKNEVSYYNGISYNKSGFTSVSERLYDTLVAKDSTVMEDEYFVTKGFERNNIVSANLINLEFLFNDDVTDNYKINRYFGLYVTDNEEGSFLLDGEEFFRKTRIEKTQTPYPINKTDVSETLVNEYNLTNQRGILLFTHDIDTITALPKPEYIDTIASYFYVKDKENNFHNIKTGSVWNDNQIRIADTEVDVSKFSGFSPMITSSKGISLSGRGRAGAMFKIIGELDYGYTISFYEGTIPLVVTGDSHYIGEVSAVETNNDIGEAYETFFNRFGAPKDVAISLAAAINNIRSTKKTFKALAVDDTVIVENLVEGFNFNSINFVLSSSTINLEPYPNTHATNNFFAGGSGNKDSRVKIHVDDILKFNTDRYIKTKTGYALVTNIGPYLDERTYDEFNNITTYSNFNNYRSVVLKGDKIYYDSNSKVSIYELFRPKFGRFSFYPIRDFDVDFYSTEYFDLGELYAEEDEYNEQDASGNYIYKANHPDIRDFYETGFGRLQGILQNDTPEGTTTEAVTNEYDRLKENYIRELSNISRVVPYINKWVYKEGKDLRNKDYRLNFSGAFGLHNFSPSSKNIIQDPDSFTHEWYYLSKYPEYFTESDVLRSWSYFDKKAYDNFDGNSILPPALGYFQDIDTDNFTDYFTVDRVNFNNAYIPIDRQQKYSTLEYGSKYRYAETFFRGIKVITKQRSDYNLAFDDKLSLNYNIKNLSLIQNGKFNGYKFSAIMIPHQNKVDVEYVSNVTERSGFQIKFVENQKWKTITLMIFLDIDYTYLDGDREFIDRTLLYSLLNKLDAASGDQPFATNDYQNVRMQGALDFITSSGTGPYLIKGTTDTSGVPTNFVHDITIGSDGKYNQIYFTIPGTGTGAGSYKIEQIDRVVNENTLLVNRMTYNDIPIPSFPLTTPIPNLLKGATYNIIDGGYQAYLEKMKSSSFADIYDRVNRGNPDVIYETVKEDGTLTYNEFVVELVSPDMVIRPLYLQRVVDEDKPVAFNLIETIGYRAALNPTIELLPFFRHSGYYNPKFKDIVKFEDPYILKGYPATGADELTAYESSVFDEIRYGNTQFKLDEDFGKLQNVFYHKVNEENPGSILELSNISAFLSRYPLIGETGIDKTDRYIFSSAWDPGYFIKNKNKINTENVAGTRSTFEKKSYFGSKMTQIPDAMPLETFEIAEYPGDDVDLSNFTERVFYEEDDNNIIFHVYLADRLTDELYINLYPEFNKYVNPLYGFGRKDTLEDDIKDYITNNILIVYKINTIDLYVKGIKSDGTTSYAYMDDTNENRLTNNLNIDRQMSIKYIKNSNLNFKITYNKISGYTYSFGLSVDLDKK